MPANSDISTWAPPYSVPAVDRSHATVPLAMYRDIVRQWSESEAVTLELRARLSAHGDDADGPAGTVTLTRLRRLEDVMDLARAFMADQSPDNRAALAQAIHDAGRAP